MRKNGVLELEEEGFKIKLDPGFLPKKETKRITTDAELLKNDPEAAMPSDGDMLYWSTGSFEDIVDGRKKPAINEENA